MAGHEHRKRRRAAKVRPGASPGTFSVDPHAPRPEISVIAFGPDDVIEERVAEVSTLAKRIGKRPVTWVNVDGLGDAAVLQEVAAIFGLHPLALEDVVSVGHRPKVEVYDEHLFVVLRMAIPERPGSTEQLSLFLGENYVLTFQEAGGDCFNPIRERLRSGKGRMRRSGPDYLAYALMDAVIDSHFPIVDALGDRLEKLESEVFLVPARVTASEIQAARATLRGIRRATAPHREVANALLRTGTRFVSDETRVFLRDCADHAEQVTEYVELYRETSSDLMDAYLSTVSNRMTEVMKVLTIIAAIFIPLSFVAGVYGMNFDRDASRWNMPELGHPWGYPAVLLLMLSIAAGLLLLFRRRGWLGK